MQHYKIIVIFGSNTKQAEFRSLTSQFIDKPSTSTLQIASFKMCVETDQPTNRPTQVGSWSKFRNNLT